jgi:2-methylcitrate dehydratase PrpD
MVVFADQRPKIRDGLTSDVSAWAHDLDFSDLSQEVIDCIKRECLDFVALALAGSTGRGVGETGKAGIAPVIAFVEAHRGNATVIGTRLTSSPQYAALANGTFEHALNLHDMHRPSVPTHIAPSVFASAFAVSQMVKVDFPMFATATTIGFQITARLAMALQPGKGSVETVPANSLGAAIEVAKLLGLNQQQMSDSLGIATYLTCGAAMGLELTSPGYWCRPMLSGWQAHNGVVAGMMAQQGLQGSPRILEAPYGFLNSFSDAPDASQLESLSNPFEITLDGFKPYPTTRYLHTELGAILPLVIDNNVDPKEVNRIVIEKPLALHEVTGAEERKNPKTPEVARLSSYYFSAVAVLRRSAWLEALEPDVFNAPETWDMMKKVVCVHNPEFDHEFPDKYPCRVTIELKSGEKLSAREDYPKGDPENPMTTVELIDKANRLYDYCFSDVVSRDKFDEILERTMSLEKEDDLGAFCRLLVNDS